MCGPRGALFPVHVRPVCIVIQLITAVFLLSWASQSSHDTRPKLELRAKRPTHVTALGLYAQENYSSSSLYIKIVHHFITMKKKTPTTFYYLKSTTIFKLLISAVFLFCFAVNYFIPKKTPNPAIFLCTVV